MCWANVSSNNALWLLHPDGVFDIVSSPASGFPNYMTGRLHFTALQNNPAFLLGQHEAAFSRYTYARWH